MKNSSALPVSKTNTPVKGNQSALLTNNGFLKQLWKNKDAYAMMAPFMMFFLLFTLIPVIISIYYSFTYYNMLQPARFIGWMNYMRMFVEDNIFVIAVKNTLVFALITGPICYMLCFFVAWFINDLPPKFRAIATILFYAPFISGQAFTIWLFIFSPDEYGIVNGFLMNLGILKEPIGWLLDPTYNFKILILVQIWMSLGAGFLAFIAGLQGVNRELYEAGVIDGIRNRFQELWYITLPAMRPQLIFGAVMQIVASFAVADISIKLCGFPSTEYSAHTILTHILDYGTIRYEMGYASAMATILFVTMIISNKLVTAMLRNVGK